jgi:hypothetical protein
MAASSELVLDPHFAPYVEPLVRPDAKRRCRLESLSRGDTAPPEHVCDRFVLAVPYAGRELRWSVLFNASAPELPPDIILGEQDDWGNSAAAAAVLQPLRQWDTRATTGLAAVVDGLVELYRQQQKSLVQSLQHEGLQWEYDTFIGARGDVDCLVESDGGFVTVECTVPIALSAGLVARVAGSSADASCPLLRWRRRCPLASADATSANSSGGDATDTRVDLPAAWDLGGFDAALPAWESGSCLMDFVPACTAHPEAALALHVTAVQARKACIEAMVRPPFLFLPRQVQGSFRSGQFAAA